MKHTAVIKKAPELSGKYSIPDGAFCGNGDLAAVLGNSGSGLRVYLTKCDFWLADERIEKDGGISPLALIDIDIPQRLYEHYYAEQRMDEGKLFLYFENGEEHFALRLFVCACKNAVLLETDSNTAGISEPRLMPFSCGRDYETVSRSSENGLTFVSRCFSGDNLKFTTSGAAAMKRIDENRFIVFASTNHDRKSFKEDCKEFILSADKSVFEELSQAHEAWWKEFWSKSSFTLSDPELENGWYASQYTLAVCARNLRFPPGLYGNFITTSTANWKGDYHLNYNYQAPFYALFSSNHTELSDCYVSALEDFLPSGRELAQKIGCGGIYCPVAIGPLGMCTEKSEPSDPLGFARLFLGQKSNAVHAADILVFRWYSTRDTEYAKKHIYPYLKECADFWESYLVFENGQFNVYDDAIHEVPYYLKDFDEKKHKKEIHAKNNLLTLGLLRMLFSALLDISAALSEDEERRERWQDILLHLAPFPTQTKRMKKVFRYTEKGIPWNDRNFLCLQHVYPAGSIDSSSDAKLLKIARNTFFINDRWDDDNAGSSIFPCAVRIGISPELIIDKLRATRKKFLLPNMLIKHGGGCLENSPVVASTLNEMALGCAGGVISFFPAWDNRLDCGYENLRANGAFLVSASIEGGRINDISVFSEIGGDLTFENPYEKCCVNSRTYSERVVKIATNVGDEFRIVRA